MKALESNILKTNKIQHYNEIIKNAHFQIKYAQIKVVVESIIKKKDFYSLQEQRNFDQKRLDWQSQAEAIRLMNRNLIS